MRGSRQPVLRHPSNTTNRRVAHRCRLPIIRPIGRYRTFQGRRCAMSEKVYNVPAEWAARAFLDNEKYLAMYKRSLDDPNGFWGEAGKRIDWVKPYTKVKNTTYGPGNVSIKWYEDG